MVLRYTLIIIYTIAFPLLAKTQTEVKSLSLTEAYQLLEERYPAIKNGELISKINENELEILSRSQKPKIYLKSDATLQTESLTLETPSGVPSPVDINIPLYSVKAYGEMQYLILDGGIYDSKKLNKDLEKQLALQEVEITRYQLREHINNLFLNIVQLREQEQSLIISLEDLRHKLEFLESAIKEGVLLESEADKMKVKILEISAVRTNIKFGILSALNTLSKLLDIPITNQTELIFPIIKEPLHIESLDRPELKLFELQKQQILTKSFLIDAQRRPKLTAFAQAGAGAPNPVNFFEEDLNLYGIVGLQFSWKLSQPAIDKIKKQSLQLKAELVNNQKESFVFNLDNKKEKYYGDLERIDSQLQLDKEILGLQKRILESGSFQLKEGVITSSEYITLNNNELLARQNLNLHKIERLRVVIEFWNQRALF